MQVPISDWNAWAPGLNSHEDWSLFLNGKLALLENDPPDVSFLSPMFRRKLSLLSRMIFCTFNKLKDKESLKGIPLIFASRHGELDLSISLINSGLDSLTCSPAKFSISVHNSPVGLLSIQDNNTGPSTAISSGKRTLEMGLIEAICTMEAFEEALLIYADLPLNEEYEEYIDEEAFPVCIAIHLKQLANSTTLSFSDKEKFQARTIIEQLIER